MTGTELPDVSGDWLAAMRRGDWEAAWRATDVLELPRRAHQHEPGFVRRPEHLHWDGTPTAGRTVVVRCEHGLGDTLQFMRLLPLLQAAHLHLLVQPPLVDLLRDVAGLGEVRNYWTTGTFPPHDVDMEVMELAYALRMTPQRLPAPLPGLRAKVSQHFELPHEGRLRVGLVWSCSHWEPSRSIPLADLAPLFAIEEVQFYSLQHGEAATDPLLQRIDIEPLSPRTSEIRAAAAAMCALDLVITIDSMPAHLAGSLGCPTWVLLKQAADWRWMDARADSPWYPTMRLFRQQRDGDWRSVAHEVARCLRAEAWQARNVPAHS